MKIIALATFLLLSLCSCASIPSGERVVQHFTQSRSLSRANELLQAGDRVGAVRELNVVTDAKGITGITDEALFRLALLNIHPVADPGSNLHAINLLKRLKREYPASRWTVQSGQLIELLSGVEDLRRQIKNLRSQNQDLGSELNELNRNIDQLKQLDQDLEKKRR